MEKVTLSDNLKISRIVHGYWRLTNWNFSLQEILKLTEQALELGITTFDHADIYGNYSCEKFFGDALNLKKNIRKDIQIITKCGIKLVSDKFPERKIKIYDYSYEHIITSVEKSLQNFGTDYIDLLLLHRPAPFLNPKEISKAFSELKKSGKVLNFGVSNFSPTQFEMLNLLTEEKLVTNQVEISPYCLENFENGNFDFFQKEKIKPMAWSPLAGGKLINPQDNKANRIHQVLCEIAEELNINSIEKIILAWLLNHPAGIIPILGTGKIDRLNIAAEAISLKLSLEQWYRIYNASTGVELP